MTPTNSAWACVQWENRTAYDTFNEETFEGPTNVERDIRVFGSEESAIDFYTREKVIVKFCHPAIYWSYPRECSYDDLEKIKANIKKYGGI